MAFKWTEESKLKLSETRKRMFSEGKLQSTANKRTIIPPVDHVPEDFGHYFAGLTDGEGCFYAGKRPGRIDGVLVSFRLSLRVDDEAIIREIHSILGFGHFRYGNTSSTWSAQFDVTSAADCMALVALFTRTPLRAKKRRDFEAWARIVEVVYSNYHVSVKDVAEDLKLMQQVKHPNLPPLRKRLVNGKLKVVSQKYKQPNVIAETA